MGGYTMPLSRLIENPQAFLLNLLLSVPAILIALIFHEVAHGYVAYRCGDLTAKMLGRLSLNPLKHLDPVGTLMMVFAGFGWARPVPVNPRNYKNARRDDLLVSIAGVVTNLILCLLFSVILYLILILSLKQSEFYRFIDEETVAEIFAYAPMISDGFLNYFMDDWLVFLYQMISRIVTANFVIAVFNLIPVPPLDGYHVLNDLVLNRPALFASRNAMMAGNVILMALIFTGAFSRAMNFLLTGAFGGLGAAARWIAAFAGI